jgi:hypothetical protein
MGHTLSFDRVAQGIQALKDFGIQRATFQVAGLQITVRTLHIDEIRQVNQYVSSHMAAYDDVYESPAHALEISENFGLLRKVETVAYAIERIGDLDLQGADYVETSEVSEHGARIKVERHVFMRDLLSQMDRHIVDVCSAKYADLLDDAKDAAYEGVTFHDLNDRIAAAENRVRYLKEMRGDFESEETDSEEVSQDDILTEEALREQVFKPVQTEEEAEILLTERAEGSTPPPPPKKRNPEPPREQFEAEGQVFVRLDEPDEPLSDEEKRYMEEQEALYQQRGLTPPKKERTPLNQSIPQLHQGHLASQQPTRIVRRSQMDTQDFEVGQGIHGPQHLGKGGAPQGPPAQNKPPKK